MNRRLSNANIVRLALSLDKGHSSGPVVVTVSDRDVTDLLVVTSPGATAAGRVVFEGDAKPSFAPQAVNMAVVPVEFSMMLTSGGVRVREDWSFEATGLSGQRRFRLNTPHQGGI